MHCPIAADGPGHAAPQEPVHVRVRSSVPGPQAALHADSAHAVHTRKFPASCQRCHSVGGFTHTTESGTKTTQAQRDLRHEPAVHAPVSRATPGQRRLHVPVTHSRVRLRKPGPQLPTHTDQAPHADHADGVPGRGVCEQVIIHVCKDDSLHFADHAPVLTFIATRRGVRRRSLAVTAVAHA